MRAIEPSSARRQSGSVLFVALVLLLLAGLLTVVALKAGVYEQRSTGNDVRARVVNEVAEAGPRVVARCLMPFPSRPMDWVPHVRVAQALIPMDGTDPAQLVGRLELLLATAPADSRRAVFLLSRPPVTRPAALAGER